MKIEVDHEGRISGHMPYHCPFTEPDAPTLPPGEYRCVTFHTRDPQCGDDEIDRMNEAIDAGGIHYDKQGLVEVAIPAAAIAKARQ